MKRIAKEKKVSEEITSALERAFKFYGQENAIIALINESHYQVLSDIRILIDRLREVCKIDIKVYTMQEIYEWAIVDENGKLWIEGKEVAVAYFRTGYVPSNYVDNSYQGWLLIEWSAAIKCPNVDLQLVTFKKV